MMIRDEIMTIFVSFRVDVFFPTLLFLHFLEMEVICRLYCFSYKRVDMIGEMKVVIQTSIVNHEAFAETAMLFLIVMSPQSPLTTFCQTRLSDEIGVGGMWYTVR